MSTSTWWQPNTATGSITFTNSYQTAIRLDSNNPQYVEGFTRTSELIDLTLQLYVAIVQSGLRVSR